MSLGSALSFPFCSCSHCINESGGDNIVLFICVLHYCVLLSVLRIWLHQIGVYDCVLGFSVRKEIGGVRDS